MCLLYSRLSANTIPDSPLSFSGLFQFTAASTEVPSRITLTMCTTTSQRRRALHTSEANDGQRTSWSSFSRTPLVATATAFGVLMLAFHVRADTSDLHGSNNPLFFDRLKEGPLGLTKADLILFGAIFLLAFELLQFLVEGSGSEFRSLH